MEINLSLIETLAVAVGVLYMGKILNRKIKVLEELCIPEAVTGGGLFSILTLMGYETGIFNIIFEDSMREIFMIAFFTTVGYSASLKLLKKAGMPVFMFLLAAVLLAVMQNVVGVGLATVLNIDPLLGLATGSLSTTGGPGTAGAFAPMLEAAGAKGATVVAMATATYALLAGSIIGGPVAKKLINKHKLLNQRSNVSDSEEMQKEKSLLSGENLLLAAFEVIIAMGIGSILSEFFIRIGLILPSYIGAMFAASIIRNITDISRGYKVKLEEISIIGNFTLAMFLSMTLMTFKLWELKELALPLIAMLIGQTLLMGVFAYFVTFHLMGRDYDAAVMVSGHCGCGFGTTPKALANMEALTNRYIPSPKAFFIIPLVGGLFIDFFNVAIITFFINALS